MDADKTVLVFITSVKCIMCKLTYVFFLPLLSPVLPHRCFQIFFKGTKLILRLSKKKYTYENVLTKITKCYGPFSTSNERTHKTESLIGRAWIIFLFIYVILFYFIFLGGGVDNRNDCVQCTYIKDTVDCMLDGI